MRSDQRRYVSAAIPIDATRIACVIIGAGRDSGREEFSATRTPAARRQIARTHARGGTARAGSSPPYLRKIRRTRSLAHTRISASPRLAARAPCSDERDGAGGEKKGKNGRACRAARAVPMSSLNERVARGGTGRPTAINSLVRSRKTDGRLPELATTRCVALLRSCGGTETSGEIR